MHTCSEAATRSWIYLFAHHRHPLPCHGPHEPVGLSGSRASAVRKARGTSTRPVYLPIRQLLSSYDPPMEESVSTTRLDRHSTERLVPLRRALGVTTFGLNQLVLGPGQRGRIHRHHRQEEVYLVIEGTLTLVVEGEQTDLEAGELVRVPPQARRQLVNRGPEQLILLAIGGHGEHQGRDGEAFSSWDQEHGVPPQELELPPDLPV